MDFAFLWTRLRCTVRYKISAQVGSVRALPARIASVDDARSSRPQPQPHRPKCRLEEADVHPYADEAIIGTCSPNGTTVGQFLVNWKDSELRESWEALT